MNTLFRSALIYLSLGASIHPAQAVSHLVPRSTVRTATVCKRMDRPLASAARHYSSKPDIFVDAYYRLPVVKSSEKFKKMLPFLNRGAPNLKSVKILNPDYGAQLTQEAKKATAVINKLYNSKTSQLDTVALEWLVTQALPINYSNISFKENHTALDFLMLLMTSELYKLNVILWKAAQRLKREWTFYTPAPSLSLDVLDLADLALSYSGPTENPNLVTRQVINRTVDKWQKISHYSRHVKYISLLEGGVFKLRESNFYEPESIAEADETEEKTVQGFVPSKGLAVKLLQEEKSRVMKLYQDIPVHPYDEPYSLAEVVDLLFRILNGPLE